MRKLLLVLCFAVSPALAQTEHDGAILRQKSPNPSITGHYVWPGTNTGLCTDPVAAPATQKFTPASPNASTIAPGTYYLVYELGNKNGRTLKSPQATVSVSSGEAVQVGWDINAGDHAFLTGCYKMRVLVGTVNGGPYYPWTPWTRKINLATITRSSNVVTATTTGQHGLVPLDTVTIVSVTCGGGGACTNSFNGTFVLDEGTFDPITGTSQLKWTQSGANESGDASTGQAQDNNQTIDTDWHIATSLYGNRGPVFNTAVPTGGTQPASTNTAVIDGIQVAANLVRSLNGTSDPLYYAGAQYRLGLVNNFSKTLTTPLVCANMRIEGSGITTLQSGPTTPLIKSTWEDANAGTLMVMGPGCQTDGVIFQSTGLTTPAGLEVQGMHTHNGLHFTRTVFIADSTSSANNAAYRFRATPITFAGVFEEGNFIGGRWNVVADRSILAQTVFKNWRFNCGARNDSGAIKVLGGPDNPDRANGDGDGVTSALFTLDNSVTESCRGKQVHGTALTLKLQNYSLVADPATQAGTEAMGKWETEFWSNGGSIGNGLILEGGSQFNGNANAATTVKQETHGGGAGMFIRGYGGFITSSGSSYVSAFDGGSASTNFLFQFMAGGAGTAGFTCDGNETSTSVQAGKVINQTLNNNSSPSYCFGMGDAATNTWNANNKISGPIEMVTSGIGAEQSAMYFGVPKGSNNIKFWPSWGFLNAAKTGCEFHGSNTIGASFTCYQTDGSTVGFRYSANTSNPYVLIGPVAAFSNSALNIKNNWAIRYPNAADNANVIMLNRNASDEGIVCQAAAGCKFGPHANTGLILGFLVGSSTIDFGTQAANTCTDSSAFTVTGAADGDPVVLGPVNAVASLSGLQYTAYVSATNQVKVRQCNVATSTSSDPASSTFKVTVIKQ